MTNTRRIQDSYRAITLRTTLLRVERVIGWATQSPIWLRRKCGAGKAMGKGGAGPLRWPIHNGRRKRLRRFRLVNRRYFDFTGGSKFGCAQFDWSELSPQF